MALAAPRPTVPALPQLGYPGSRHAVALGGKHINRGWVFDSTSVAAASVPQGAEKASDSEEHPPHPNPLPRQSQGRGSRASGHGSYVHRKSQPDPGDDVCPQLVGWIFFDEVRKLSCAWRWLPLSAWTASSMRRGWVREYWSAFADACTGRALPESRCRAAGHVATTGIAAGATEGNSV